ncbi:MAG: ribonuclease III [Lachnospiraceae bacterium]|nr:ribonuclease III [Lachnospiraceae bacterium]
MLNFNEKEIEKNIQYEFNDKMLIKQAMSHSSFINEMKLKGMESYERLEFLGDAVLELISSEYLFEHYADMPEGKLTKLRASIVCEYTLSSVSKMLHFGDYVLLSRGEEQTGGRMRSSILCDLFESVLGAVYLDGGMDAAKKYVYTFLMTDLENKQLFYDAKTTLQEMVQKDGKGIVTYELLEEKGPDHNKTFVTEALVDGIRIAKGEGTSKKNAQQMAAYKAILKIKESQ